VCPVGFKKKPDVEAKDKPACRASNTCCEKKTINKKNNRGRCWMAVVMIWITGEFPMAKRDVISPPKHVWPGKYSTKLKFPVN